MTKQIVYLSGMNLTTGEFIDRKPILINRNLPVWSQLELKIGGCLSSKAGICGKPEQFPGCQG